MSGGKGGVGKTVVAVNLALLTARAGHRTLLVDLDPGLGNVDVHLRLAPRFSLEDCVEGKCSLDQALTDAGNGIHVLTGKSGSTRLASGDPEFLQRTFHTIQEAARGFDVVICDTGAGIGPVVVECSARAEISLVVTAPEPAAATDAYALCKVLQAHGGPEPMLVVNRAKTRDEAMRTGGKLAAVCERFLGMKPGIAGWVLTNQAIERSTVEQRPCASFESGEAVDDLRALTASVLSHVRVGARSRTQRTATRLLARG